MCRGVAGRFASITQNTGRSGPNAQKRPVGNSGSQVDVISTFRLAPSGASASS
jgi:hypothetical protein